MAVFGIDVWLTGISQYAFVKSMEEKKQLPASLEQKSRMLDSVYELLIVCGTNLHESWRGNFQQESSELLAQMNDYRVTTHSYWKGDLKLMVLMVLILIIL